MLGERLSYVLLPGMRTQDEAAEDPFTAAKSGAAADYELYWHNKLRKPLTEILTTCLSPTALQARCVVLGPKDSLAQSDVGMAWLPWQSRVACKLSMHDVHAMNTAYLQEVSGWHGTSDLQSCAGEGTHCLTILPIT